MPELPDVEHFRRVLASSALGRTVAKTEVRRKEILEDVSPAHLGKALKGNRFEAADRHGKHLFLRLADGGWLLLHFGMTGYPRVYEDPGEEPDHARFVAHFEDGGFLAVSMQRLLGRIRLVEEKEAYLEELGLGPDAASVDLPAFREILKRTGGTLKGFLLNQGRIAGVGNIYGDEILFQARMHPKASPRDLDADEARDLHRALKRVLRKAADIGADPDRMPRSWVIPSREEGGTCPRCGGPLERISVSGRNGFWCPRCQTRGAPHPAR